MQTNVDKLRKDQEKAAGDAAAARSEYDTRKDTYIASVQKLQERLHRSVSSITEQSSVTEMSNALENWKQELAEELKKQVHSDDVPTYETGYVSCPLY